jgi:hypothetical protein
LLQFVESRKATLKDRAPISGWFNTLRAAIEKARAQRALKIGNHF